MAAEKEYYTVVQVCMKSTTQKMFEFELQSEKNKPDNKKSASRLLFERLKESYKANPPKGYML